jgi:DNA-binding NtrC family response regulator
MTSESPAVARFRASSPALLASFEGFERAAASLSPALVVGEAGSGRSTLARLIHAASPRAEAPLVELDPVSLPPSLLESELFGYRAGAFTGAERGHAGRVARAQGGSLLLDHVEELPVGAQPKLLRLLAESRYSPLGGADIEADVRFLAIGSDDLERRVELGTLRRDLFHRLEVLTWRVPPLRARRDDFAPLVAALLADLGERFARPGLELSERARAWMSGYSWPGNLRELRNVLERALLLARGPQLDPPAPAAGAAKGEPMTLAAAERAAIVAALAASRGHQAEAAKSLGISRKGLWEKRKRLGVP